MQKFTQKYTLIQLFEDIPTGTQFSSSSWPLHSTIVDTFAIDWDVPTMVLRLEDYLSQKSPVESVVLDDTFFGEEGQIRVVLIQKNDELVALHEGIVILLEEGGLKLNDPQFALDGFLPHSTVQKHARLNKGDVITFNSLALVDMFPDENPYERKILAIIPIGASVS